MSFADEMREEHRRRLLGEWPVAKVFGLLLETLQRQHFGNAEHLFCRNRKAA
jgi:hypothetical protein